MFIELKNVRKQYNAAGISVWALDNISLGLDKGTMAVVLGPSGSGKSTLLNVLGGLDSCDAGFVKVGDYELSGLKPKQKTDYRSKEVGFVFQSYNLISDLTVRENLEVIYDISENHLTADDVLRALDIYELKDRFPDELSGGQQQRVAIARAMIKAPELLLCDELTGALDTKTSLNVLTYLEKLNQTMSTTVIIVTHNEAIAAMADIVIRLKDGRITEMAENTGKVSAAELSL